MRIFTYKDVKDVISVDYRPSYVETDYVFRFDTLVVHYSDMKSNVSFYQDWDIVFFLETIEKYSICDISAIWKEIERKKCWYIKQEPYHPNLPNKYIDFQQGVYFLLSKASQQGEEISFEKQRERLKRFCVDKKLCFISEFQSDDYDYRSVAREIIKASQKKSIDIILMAIGKYQERRFDIPLYWELAVHDIKLEVVYIWEDKIL